MIPEGSLQGQEPSEVTRRGLFVSVIQEPPVLSSRDAILKLVAFSKQAHVQVIFLQLYFGNKAWFPSQVGDTGPYGACLKSVGEDPVSLLIKEAHAAGIQVHAWLNMLSVNSNGEAPLLKKYGESILTRDKNEKRLLADYKIDNQYFLEPGDSRVRKELLEMAGEVLGAYPQLDGIQFDYIRYPDVHPVYGHTDENLRRFRESTGIETLEDSDPRWQQWKRDQVTEFLRMLVQKVRLIRPDIQVSVTGCMPYARAYYEAFQDWPSWVNQGLVDFVTLMNYSPDPEQFERWNLNAKVQVQDTRKMNVGVGAYKLVHEPEKFSKEFRSCEATVNGACVVFHYGSLLENPVLSQVLFEGP